MNVYKMSVNNLDVDENEDTAYSAVNKTKGKFV